MGWADIAVMWPQGREHEDSWHQSQDTGLSWVPGSFQGMWLCQPLDFRILASGAAREYMSVLSHQVPGLLQQHQEIQRGVKEGAAQGRRQEAKRNKNQADM